jgi:hypothetical protein
MTVGIASGTANLSLDTLNTASTTTTGVTYVKLHIGDPGSAGTANPCTLTTRVAVTWAASSGGSKSANGTLPSWTISGISTYEDVSHISIWDASTAGNFRWSVALTGSAKRVVNGDTLSLTSLTLAFTPIAA